MFFHLLIMMTKWLPGDYFIIPLASLVIAGVVVMFPDLPDAAFVILSLCCFLPLPIVGVGIALVIRAANVVPWHSFFDEDIEDKKDNI